MKRGFSVIFHGLARGAFLFRAVRRRRPINRDIMALTRIDASAADVYPAHERRGRDLSSCSLNPRVPSTPGKHICCLT